MNDAVNASLLDVSERMLAAARAGDWDAVASLETERSEHITSLPVNAPDALPILKTLLSHTEEVRELARQQRDRISADLSQHGHRHRALSAYLHAGVK